MPHTGQYDQKIDTVTQTQNNSRSDQGLKIFVYDDLSLVGQYFFSCKKVVIGQNEDADLHLRDPHLSDIQAIIHIRNDNIIISDRSENTGVYLNGRPIKAAVLDPLDLIEIGKYSLSFQVTSDAAKPNQNYRKAAANQDHKDIRSHKRSLAALAVPDPPHHPDGLKKAFCRPKSLQDKSIRTLRKNPSQPKSKQSKYKHDSSRRNDFFELPPYKGGTTAPEQRSQSATLTSPMKQKKHEGEEDFLELAPFKIGKMAAEQPSRSAAITSSKKQNKHRFAEDFFELPPFKNGKKAAEQPSRSTAITSSKKQKKHGFTEDFFELPPYREDKKASAVRSRSAPIAPSNKQKKPEDSFKLSPYKGGKKATVQRSRSATLTSTKQQKKQRYEEDFFTLPPYPSNKKTILERSPFSAHISAPQDKSRRFNLLFSGEFKPGWTLLQVKKNLNRQFGIDYRKLMFLIKGKPIILKRNLTYDKATKLYKAFEVSGAICFIEPIENKSKAPIKKKHNKITASDNQKKFNKDRKDRKLIDPNNTNKWSGSGNREEKKLADLDKNLADLLDQPSRKICYCVNVHEKSARRQKNKPTKALSTIRKSGIFSGSKKEAAINHLSSLD
jgi:pSer/pThr/pTyr-binding forkhead associated (FHA) protein